MPDTACGPASPSCRSTAIEMPPEPAIRGTLALTSIAARERWGHQPRERDFGDGVGFHGAPLSGRSGRPPSSELDTVTCGSLDSVGGESRSNEEALCGTTS
jgi:hypothetical protein